MCWEDRKSWGKRPSFEGLTRISPFEKIICKVTTKAGNWSWDSGAGAKSHRRNEMKVSGSKWGGGGGHYDIGTGFGVSQSSMQDRDHVEKLALGSKCNGKTPKGFWSGKGFKLRFPCCKDHTLSSSKHRVEGPSAESRSLLGKVCVGVGGIIVATDLSAHRRLYLCCYRKPIH